MLYPAMLGEGIAVELLAKILHHVVALELTMDKPFNNFMPISSYQHPADLSLPLQKAVVTCNQK